MTLLGLIKANLYTTHYRDYLPFCTSKALHADKWGRGDQRQKTRITAIVCTGCLNSDTSLGNHRHLDHYLVLLKFKRSSNVTLAENQCIFQMHWKSMQCFFHCSGLALFPPANFAVMRSQEKHLHTFLSHYIKNEQERTLLRFKHIHTGFFIIRKKKTWT